MVPKALNVLLLLLAAGGFVTAQAPTDLPGCGVSYLPLPFFFPGRTESVGYEPPL